MCGLVGCAGKLGLRDEKAFKNLLYMDALRGRHSTGVFQLTGGNTYSITKQALAADEFLDDEGAKSIFRDNNRVLIGHNRYATQGAVNGINAHPFEHGNIVGAHNGTLVNQTLLPDSHLFEVDSDNIFHSINKVGVKDTVGKLHGAYALSFYNLEDQTLNFVRNDERTLFYTWSDDGTLFWASEKFMLIAALDRNNIKHTRVRPFLSDRLYSFNVNPEALSFSSAAAIDKPRVSEVTPFVPPKYPRRESSWSSTPPLGGTSSSNRNDPFLKSARTTRSKNPEFIRDRGVEYSDDIYFSITEQLGNTLSGVALNNDKFDIAVFGCTVVDKDVIQKVLDHIGYFISSRLGGCITNIGEEGRYTLTCQIWDLVPKEWEDWLSPEDNKEVNGNVIEGDFSKVEDKDIPVLVDPAGRLMDQHEFNSRFTNCAWCSSPLFFDDDDMALFRDDEGLCGDCAKDSNVTQYLQ